MNWIEIRVRFEAAQPDMAEELIADRFHTLGFTGVVIEDPRADVILDWAQEIPPAPEHHAVVGYCADNGQGAARLAALQAALAQLADQAQIALKVSQRKVAEEQWAESWKTYFKPVRITRRMVVKPTWEDWDAAPDELVIDIDPGMAFGTGTHPTTTLCLQLLEDHLKPDDTFLDIGTGSGILMIAAAKLGVCRLTGVDSDAVAVDTARSNMAVNGIDPGCYDIREGRLTSGLSRQYTLITANILTPVILQLLDLVGRDDQTSASPLLKDGGRIIVSGILAENQHQVADKMRQVGFTLKETRELKEWCALVGSLQT